MEWFNSLGFISQCLFVLFVLFVAQVISGFIFFPITSRLDTIIDFFDNLSIEEIDLDDDDDEDDGGISHNAMLV